MPHDQGCGRTRLELEIAMKTCHKCGAEWEGGKRQPAYKDICGSCTAYLHCCLNCKYYDTSCHNGCYIPNTDWIGDKRGLNFCDEFEFADGPRKNSDDTSQVRQAFADLLGDDSDSEEKQPDIDSLFGD